MKNLIIDLIGQALTRLNYQIPPDSILLGRPQRKNHGDYSTNLAIVSAATIGKPSIEIAKDICEQVKILDVNRMIKKVEIAGPGFINFFINDNQIQDYLSKVVKSGDKYGTANKEIKVKVLVEFVSANPTGPLHIGHGRWAVLGDAVAALLESVGCVVEREFYINDVGRQINLLKESVAARRQGLPSPEGGYGGEYISHIPSDADAVEFLLCQQKETLNNLGVKFDNWFSESQLHNKGKIQIAMNLIKEKGFTYEKDGAIWFRSTDFGDDKDRVIVRENGDSTYFAADIAYHTDKFQRNYDLMIDIWGTDHHGYISRLKAAMKAIGNSPEKLEIIIGQLVTLFRGKEQIRMSKRTGEMITLQEVIDEIGRDACRFFFLLNKADAHLDFDMELAKQQNSDNPVYYVQYAHARICSIFKETNLEYDNPNLSLLSHECERELINKLIDFPDEVIDSARLRSPHRLTNYSIEVSKLFHSFYHKCRVLTDDKDLTAARLYLMCATRIVLSNVLKLLGISAPERM